MVNGTRVMMQELKDVYSTVYSTEVLKFNLCDDNDAYILRKGNITIPGNTAVQAEFRRLCTIHWVYHKNW